jgi:hypothetical protein
MNNIESGINSAEPIPKWNDGNLEIPLEYLLGEQQFLMLTMVPEEIKPYVEESDGEQVGIEERLFERWCEKYSKLFREYCNNLDPNDEEENKLISRIITGRLTSDDYLNLQNHLEASEDKEQGIGGKFFTDEETKEFLKPFLN